MPMVPSTPTGDNLIAQDDPQSNYMGPDQGPFKCGNCEYYIAPTSCQKVQGPIAAEGCCNLYEKGAAAANPQSLGGLRSAAQGVGS